MKNNTKAKPKKRHIIGGIATGLLILSVVSCIFVMWQLHQKGYVTIADTSVFRVVTGSMEPTMPVGAVILSKEIPIDEVQIGDIICFQSKLDYLEDATVTHRVIAIQTDDLGEIHLYTQGDANTVSDGHTVEQDNFIGKVSWFSGQDDTFSNILNGLTTPAGMIAFIILPCMLIASLVMGDAVKGIRKELLLLKNAESAPEKQEETYAEMERRIMEELKEELKIHGTEDGQQEGTE